jgi:hypothetical protein
VLLFIAKTNTIFIGSDAIDKPLSLYWRIVDGGDVQLMEPNSNFELLRALLL